MEPTSPRTLVASWRSSCKLVRGSAAPAHCTRLSAAEGGLCHLCHTGRSLSARGGVRHQAAVSTGSHTSSLLLLHNDFLQQSLPMQGLSWLRGAALLTAAESHDCVGRQDGGGSGACLEGALCRKAPTSR